MVALCAAAFLAATPVAAFAASGTQQAGKLIDAGKLDGQQVKNMQGQDLGKIKQVLIDPQSGRARYAVLEVDKAWSLDNSEIAVPFGAFQISHNGNNNLTVQLDATKEKLQNAPKHKIGEADQLFSQQASQPLYSYWAILWFDDPNSNKNSGSGTAATQSQGGSTNSGKTAGGSSSNSTTANASSSSPNGTAGSSTAGSGNSGNTPTPATNSTVSSSNQKNTTSPSTSVR